MALYKRKTTDKRGKTLQSKNWSYDFQLKGQRYQGTIDGEIFRTKREAEAERQAIRKRLKEDIEGNTLAAVSFAEAALNYDDYYNRRKAEDRKTAPNKRKQDRWLYIAPRVIEYFGLMSIDKIKRAHLAAFVSMLRSEGKKDSAIKGYVDYFSAVMGYSETIGLVESVPNFKLIKRTMKKDRVRTRYLSEKEYDKLIEQYEKIEEKKRKKLTTSGKYTTPTVMPFTTRTRMRAVVFDVETGLRTDELLSLEESDIEGKFIYVRATKNGEDRYISLSKKAQNILREQIADKRKNNINSIFIFCKKDGTKCRSMRKGFEADAKRAKIKDLCFHDLRRTFGCWRLQGIRGSKKDIKEVSNLLGHKTIKTTEKVYAFLDDKKIILD